MANELDGNVLSVIEGVWDGSYASELRDANAELNRQTQELSSAARAAASLPSGSGEQQQALALIAQGRESVAAGRQNVIVANGKLQFIAGELNRMGAGIPASSLSGGLAGIFSPIPCCGIVGLGGLSSFGVLPVALVNALYAAGVAAIVAAAAIALASAFSIVWSAVNGGKGILADIAEVLHQGGQDIQIAGGQVTNIATVILIGLAGFVGYAALKKKGHV